MTSRTFPDTAPADDRSTVGRRIFSGAVAIGVQIVFLGALVAGTTQDFVPQHETLTVVNVIAELAVVEPPPAPPAPRLDVPVIQMQAPLVTITEPRPPPAAPIAAMVETPSPPSAPVMRDQSKDPVIGFQKALLRHLNRHKRYPPGARAKREQGVVYVRFAMDRTGRVVRAGIERHSRYAPLDEEGLALLARAQPLPAPPAELAGDPLELVVPVEFSLR